MYDLGINKLNRKKVIQSNYKLQPKTGLSNYPKNGMSFPPLYPRDTDGDGVPNYRDCQKYNPNAQGIFHDAAEKIKEAGETIKEKVTGEEYTTEEQQKLSGGEIEPMYKPAEEEYEDYPRGAEYATKVGETRLPDEITGEVEPTLKQRLIEKAKGAGARAKEYAKEKYETYYLLARTLGDDGALSDWFVFDQGKYPDDLTDIGQRLVADGSIAEYKVTKHKHLAPAAYKAEKAFEQGLERASHPDADLKLPEKMKENIKSGIAFTRPGYAIGARRPSPSLPRTQMPGRTTQFPARDSTTPSIGSIGRTSSIREDRFREAGESLMNQPQPTEVHGYSQKSPYYQEESPFGGVPYRPVGRKQITLANERASTPMIKPKFFGLSSRGALRGPGQQAGRPKGMMPIATFNFQKPRFMSFGLAPGRELHKRRR